MFRDILIILDNHGVCLEALTYGRELAVRMGSRVTFLMLVKMSFVGRTLLGAKRSALARIEDQAAHLLTECAKPFLQQGIEVSSAFRVGEPAQEMLKFLADRPPFQAVVWGSAPELPAKGHWITRVAGNMECSLLTVSRKERA